MLSREPPLKRRRLAPAALQPIQPIQPIASPLADPKSTSAPVKLVGGPCAYCHRAAKPGHLLLCPRCAAPTCTVCTRTCVAVPPSRAPTPALSFSSSTTATPPASPLGHLKLDLNLSLDLDPNTPLPDRNRNRNRTSDLDALLATPTTRRRRRRGADDGLPRELADEGWLPGCGRVLCRDCCIEAPESCTVACIDCCVHPRALELGACPDMA